MTHSEKNEKCKTVSTIGVFQCTMSLLKKTHHHRDLSTTHWTARIQLLVERSFHRNVPTRHQREPLAWCHHSPDTPRLIPLGLLDRTLTSSRWWRCRRRCHCCNLSFLRLVVGGHFVMKWSPVCISWWKSATYLVMLRHLSVSKNGCWHSGKYVGQLQWQF